MEGGGAEEDGINARRGMERRAFRGKKRGGENTKTTQRRKVMAQKDKGKE